MEMHSRILLFCMRFECHSELLCRVNKLQPNESNKDTRVPLQSIWQAICFEKAGLRACTACGGIEYIIHINKVLFHVTRSLCVYSTYSGRLW
jgi:hypothetical protein